MTPATSKEQNTFESLLPEIEARLDRGFACGPEEKEELIVIGVGHAFLLFLSAIRRHNRVTPSTLALYAARMTRAGRQVESRWTKYDALAGNAHIPRPLSLNDNDLHELLEDRKSRWPLGDRVAFELDWTDFMSARSEPDKEIVGMLAKGYMRSEAAEAVGISRPRVTQRMKRLRREWDELQGDGHGAARLRHTSARECR